MKNDKEKRRHLRVHDENLGYFISIIYRHMQVHLEKEFRRYGFGSGQYMYLLHISHNKGITQKELSKDLAIDKGTTAKAINKLIAKGYVKSIINNEDKRSSKLFLTQAGRKLLPSVHIILNKTFDIMRTGIKRNEEAKTLRSLCKIAGNITENAHQQL